MSYLDDAREHLAAAQRFGNQGYPLDLIAEAQLGLLTLALHEAEQRDGSVTRRTVGHPDWQDEQR